MIHNPSIHDLNVIEIPVPAFFEKLKTKVYKINEENLDLNDFIEVK